MIDLSFEAGLALSLELVDITRLVIYLVWGSCLPPVHWDYRRATTPTQYLSRF